MDVFLKTVEVDTFNGFILLNSDKISEADCPLEVFLYRSFAHTMIKLATFCDSLPTEDVTIYTLEVILTNIISRYSKILLQGFQISGKGLVLTESLITIIHQIKQSQLTCYFNLS